MIEKHQILIDGLVKISELGQIQILMADDIAADTLKAYMGANNLEADERSFLPGYHEYITAYSYDVRHGYDYIQYSIPLNVWPKDKVPFINVKYNSTHTITMFFKNETHFIISIERL